MKYMMIFFVVWFIINICILIFNLACICVYKEFEPMICRIYNKVYNKRKLRLWVVFLVVMLVLPAVIVDTIISIFFFAVKNTNFRNLFFHD